MAEYMVPKAENVQILRDIIALVPSQGIRTNTFERLYPNWQNVTSERAELDDIIAQLLAWWLASIHLKDAQLKEKDARLEEKEVRLKEKDTRLEEKDAQLKEKDEIYNTRLKEKDAQLEEKDESLRKSETEASDVVTAIQVISAAVAKNSAPIQRWGSVTRSQAWNSLINSGNVNDVHATIPDQEHMKKADLTFQLGEIDQASWGEEKDMYPDIIEAMRLGFYCHGSDAQVIDTHETGDFRPDISVGEYKDSRLLYCLRYFFELKFTGGAFPTSEQCGQMLDYFHKVHDVQPHRREFTALLSNFDSTWVFTARFDAKTVRVTKWHARTLADAIIYADTQSRREYTKRIPPLHTLFPPDEYQIITVSRHHYLLKVPFPRVTASMRAKRGAPNTSWRAPERHRHLRSFMMKLAQEGSSVANELDILGKIRDVGCIHLPELVWAPGGNKELGIVPVGRPIDFRETAEVSRNLVQGLIDGLEHLHGQGIVHRDIRPSNLVLDHKNNAIIIDYETAVTTSVKGMEYLGGFICWPKRLLESNTLKYTPDPTDDLFACILVVLHLLFPSQFDAFRASSIMVSEIGQRTEETKQLLALWRNIEQSTIWSPFVKAAEDENYVSLKGLGDVFCHV